MYINTLMEVKIESLYTLVGKSFTLLDGTIMDIYMMFQAAPTPFYMVTPRDTNKLHQVDAIMLFSLIQSNAPELLETLY
jgi:hypothetical protein